MADSSRADLPQANYSKHALKRSLLRPDPLPEKDPMMMTNNTRMLLVIKVAKRGRIHIVACFQGAALLSLHRKIVTEICQIGWIAKRNRSHRSKPFALSFTRASHFFFMKLKA